METTDQILNVTLLEPRQKHPTIFARFDELAEGHDFIILNDHDPKPLYYQFLAERGNVFTWEYLQEGPEWWRVRIGKRMSGEKDETLGEIAAADQRKARVFQKFGLDFSCDGAKTVKEVCAEKGMDVTLVEKELQQTMNTSDADIIEFDVRPILASGVDPLKQIMEKITPLQTGQVLKIINTFVPAPLVTLLGRQGYESHVETISDDLVHAYFFKTAKASGMEPELPSETDDWHVLLQKFEGHLIPMDVRSLEMPQPMITILEALDQLKAGSALLVNHKRVPVFLLPELKERNFEYRIQEISENEVMMLIYSL